MRSYHVYLKEVRDPIYGYIYLTPLETRIIDTIVFQRLARLLQNPGTAYVYPNATHTRKAHSLGVMHLAGMALRKLLARQCSDDMRSKWLHPVLTEPVVIKMNKLGKIEKEKELDDLTNTGCKWWDDKIGEDPAFILEVVRIAALMHDVGHGPFSHIFEQAVNQTKVNPDFKHEQMSVKLLTNIEHYINPEAPKMKDEEKEIIELASKVLQKEQVKENWPKLLFLNELIDSPIDVDKLDYVNRDAYHAGPLEYGMIDYERVLDGLRVSNGKLLYSESSIGAIDRTFKALEYMYSNVYYHKTCRAVDLQVYEMLISNQTLLEEIMDNEEEYLKWSDDKLLYHIRDNGKGNSKKLADDLLARRLKYKSVAERKLPIGKLFSLAQPGLGQKQQSLEKMFKGLGAKVDHFAVSPVRLEAQKLVEWLKLEIFFTREGKLAKLDNISPLLSNAVQNFSVVARLYVERQKATDTEVEKAKQEFDREFPSL